MLCDRLIPKDIGTMKNAPRNDTKVEKRLSWGPQLPVVQVKFLRYNRRIKTSIQNQKILNQK
jgi:hypothetical protein